MKIASDSVLGKVLRQARRLRPSSSPLLKYVDEKALAKSELLVRLGTAYGGWTIPIDSGLTSNSVCYSAGAGEDLSFDCALVERYHCLVRVVDPTPRAIDHYRKLKEAVAKGSRFPINNSGSDFYSIASADFERLAFLPFGISDRDEEMRFYLPRDPAHVSCSMLNLQKTDKFFKAQCHRLSTLMKEMGDLSIDLLKMDIEGAEYGVIRDIVTSNLSPRLLLVEFDEVHTPLDNNAAARIQAHVDMLRGAGMICLAVDGSNATFVRTK